MFKLGHILKITKALLMVFFVLFLLTGCGDQEKQENTMMDAQHNTTEGRNKLLESQYKCWQSNVLIVIYDTLGTATTQVYLHMTNGALPLMMMAFAVWFVYRILVHVGSITEENIGEVWKEVLIKFFLCFVCGIVASSTDIIMYVLNTLVFPIYTAFLEFGSYVLQNNKSTGGYEDVFGEKVTFPNELFCKVTGTEVASMKEGFPQAPRNMMSCMVCAVNDRLVIGSKLAFDSMSSTWIGVILGAIVYCCFLFVRLGFVFYLVDTVFRFAIMIIILPILIMAYAFKPTRKWTKTGFILIINSSAYMCAIAIIITVTLLGMEELFSANSDFLKGTAGVIDRFEDFSVFFLCLILICFLLLQSITIAKQVSDALVGASGDTKFQKKLKAVIQFLGSVIIGLLTLGSGTAAKGVAEGAKRAGKAAAKKANEMRKKGGKAISQGAQKTTNKFMKYVDTINDKGE